MLMILIDCYFVDNHIREDQLEMIGLSDLCRWNGMQRKSVTPDLSELWSGTTFTLRPAFDKKLLPCIDWGSTDKIPIKIKKCSSVLPSFLLIWSPNQTKSRVPNGQSWNSVMCTTYSTLLLNLHQPSQPVHLYIKVVRLTAATAWAYQPRNLSTYTSFVFL